MRVPLCVHMNWFHNSILITVKYENRTILHLMDIWYEKATLHDKYPLTVSQYYKTLKYHENDVIWILLALYIILHRYFPINFTNLIKQFCNIIYGTCFSIMTDCIHGHNSMLFTRNRGTDKYMYVISWLKRNWLTKKWLPLLIDILFELSVCCFICK